MATMLLVGAGLLIHSFIKLASVDLGYDPSKVLTFQVALPRDSYPAARLETFAEDLVARLRSAPGVQAATHSTLLPMVKLLTHSAWFRRTPDPPVPTPSPGEDADLRIVGQDYLEVMGIRVVAGRGFDENDNAGQPRVVIINRMLARRDFPGETPIGKTAYLLRDSAPWQIVGIVDDVRQVGLDQEPEPQVFVDSRQWPGLPPGFAILQYYAVRTDGDPASVISHVRGVLRQLDSQAAPYNIAPMEQLVSNSISRPRLYAVLVGLFGGVALALAAIGIYGTMAYSVTRRRREIGIRMALGAQRSEVMRVVLGHGMVLTGIGIALGLAGAAAVTRYLDGMLFGLTPLDPTTLIAVSLIFAGVAMAAAYIPARRATKVDPLVALRYE